MSFGTDTQGVYAIAPTPFLPDGALDRESIAQMADFYLAAGVDGLTILGIMGEASKLTPEEKMTVVRDVIAQAHSKPVVVGVSESGFAAMRSLAHSAMEAGAAGVMIAPPSSLRTDGQICGYYRQAVASIGDDIPFVLQDHPTATNVIMANEVIRRIVEENPSCVMLKHEDWPGLEKISQLRRWQSDGSLRELSILCGNGALFLDFEMERGADGVMTGYAFPEMLIEAVHHSAASNRDAAHDIFDRHLPLLRYEQQPVVGLAVRKYVLAKRRVIRHATLRVPGPTLSDAAIAEVDYLMARLDASGS